MAEKKIIFFDHLFDTYLDLNGNTFRPLDEAKFQLTVVNRTSVWDKKK